MESKKLAWQAALACLGLSLMTGTVAAAESVSTDALSEYNLDEIVVTATTTPVEKTKTDASVAVITREEIQANHYSTLQDALLHIPGYNGIVAANGIGFEVSGYTKPAIRGSNGVVVLIDGIEQKTYDRFYGTALTRNLDDVERIEVLKGSASVLYGYNAVGGVINIITRRHYDKPVSKITLTGGSYSTRSYKFDTAGSDKNAFWSFSGLKHTQGDYKDGNGRLRPQDVDLKSMDVKYGVQLSDTTDLIFKYVRHVQYQDYCEGFARNIDTDAHGILSLTNMSAIIDYNSADGRTGNMLGVYKSTLRSDRKETGLPTSNPLVFRDWAEAFTDSTWSITDRYYHQLTPEHRLSAGFLIENNYEDNVGLRAEGLYVQDEWSINKRLKLTGGVRYSRSPQWAGKWLYGATLGYDATDRVHLYMGANQYMIPPTAGQIFGSTTGTNITLPNRNLKPTTGTSYELGAKYVIDSKTYLDFSVYRRKQNDTIIRFTPDPSMPYTRIFLNTDYNKTIHGMEMNFVKRFGKYFQATIGYARLAADSDDLIQRYPRDQVSLLLSYKRKEYDINLEGLGFYDIVPVESFVTNRVKYLPEQTYWVWNLSANYRLNDSTKLFLRVNNLLNLQYMTLVDYDSAARSMRYYSKPGRNFMLGVEYSF